MDGTGRSGVRSFSGTHLFRPACLKAALSREAIWYKREVGDLARSDEFLATRVIEMATALIEMIDAGRCPRCSGPLLPKGAPDYWLPAGSHVTKCRCVPICEQCGGGEVFNEHPPVGWPIDFVGLAEFEDGDADEGDLLEARSRMEDPNGDALLKRLGITDPNSLRAVNLRPTQQDDEPDSGVILPLQRSPDEID